MMLYTCKNFFFTSSCHRMSQQLLYFFHSFVHTCFDTNISAQWHLYKLIEFLTSEASILSFEIYQVRDIKQNNTVP